LPTFRRAGTGASACCVTLRKRSSGCLLPDLRSLFALSTDAYSTSSVMWSAVEWKALVPGADQGRPGVVGPVGQVHDGMALPATLFEAKSCADERGPDCW